MQAVLAALRENDRFVVTSHEAPDGDALGSLLGMGLALRELGKDVVMFLGGPAPLPGEFRFLEAEERGVERERPVDFAERVLVAVDCASSRSARRGARRVAPRDDRGLHGHLRASSAVARRCASSVTEP